MPLRTGCDIVCISRFRERLVAGGPELADRIFQPAELRDPAPGRLAGMFAAKEAVGKALSLPAGRWLEIAVEHDPSGAPRVVLANTHPALEDLSISISHDGDFAVAFAVALLR